MVAGTAPVASAVGLSSCGVVLCGSLCLWRRPAFSSLASGRGCLFSCGSMSVTLPGFLRLGLSHRLKMCWCFELQIAGFSISN